MKPPAIGAVLLALATCAPEPAPPAEHLGAQDEAIGRCLPSGPIARERVRGVDVSYYQGRVNWPTARAAGVAFAFARVADGDDVIDPAFTANWPAMKAAGVVRGAYQFFRPAQDPLAQAAVFLREIDARGGLRPGDLPPALDLEVSDGVPARRVRTAARAWLARVEAATGRTPIVYTSPAFWADLGDDPAFSRYTLWLAHWETACPAPLGSWTRFRFWQDGTDRAVPGIPEPVDTDWFVGTRADLERFAGGKPEPLAVVPKPARRAKGPARPARRRGGRAGAALPVDLGALLRVLPL